MAQEIFSQIRIDSRAMKQKDFQRKKEEGYIQWSAYSIVNKSGMISTNQNKENESNSKRQKF